ncbi:hypothetical protein [Saccharibacillus endophyticus]|uniref:Uncharacterized protein n=1 Tax=Saccharibacillus endophyticus TaxID=2060666 RepID=A0ABQ1ZZ70_9BACL|nr:hypothetical protein [Saccharibacillus endophyticus]GGH81293.1 hypothetical protein GCM10007362_30870 [Saccharibacillus endophyticus]
MGKRKNAWLLSLGFVLAFEETVFGFGSFALFSPRVQADGASAMQQLRNESGDFTVMKVLQSSQSSPQSGQRAEQAGAGDTVMTLSLKLDIDNRNPLKSMQNVEAEVLPGGVQEGISAVGEAVLIDVPRKKTGRYGLQLTIERKRYEQLLSGEKAAAVRVSWGHGLHRDIDLAKLLRENGLG